MTIDKVWCFVIGLMIGMTIIALASCYDISRMRDKAINAGAGRWTIDKETGDREFTFGLEKTNDN